MANQSYLTIAGTKQGKFKGQSQSGKFTPILSFDMSMQSPRDAATGQASGKRQHKPIAVLVPWTTACPQLFTAMMTNESLESVVFEFQSSKGDTSTSYKTRL